MFTKNDWEQEIKDHPTIVYTPHEGTNMFKHLQITNIKTTLTKLVDIYDYTPDQLNAITAFYSDHPDYTLDRV